MMWRHGLLLTLFVLVCCESTIKRQGEELPPPHDGTVDVTQPPEDTTVSPPLDVRSITDVNPPESGNTSCVGVCGLPFDAPGSCQCYPGCVATNVCCDDFEELCADRLFPKPPPDAQQRSRETGGLVGCYFNGIALWGDVKVVEHFQDIDVKVVEHFPELKVKWVEHFADECGLWREVEHFEDFTIRYVEHFPEFEIKLVEHFPKL